MLIKPKFYDSFRCIADKCPDTCCAGWEIDVDEDTLEYYNRLDEKSGAFVRSKLISGDDGCTKLCLEGKRCGCLRDDNLCQLILDLGEDALCDICREHPRFYSGNENVTEAGLGLCCPEAARLWLTTEWEDTYEDDGMEMSEDDEALVYRQMLLIDVLTLDEGGLENQTLGERLAGLIDDGSNCDLYDELRQLYSKLEVLDKGFPKRFSVTPTVTNDVRFRNLAAYFIFRYYFELGEELCLKFTAVSLIMIASMGGELEASAKDYSKEVEYDTDNLDKIYEMIEACGGIAELCRLVLRG